MICSLKVALKYVISVLSKLHESVLIRLQSGPTGCALAKKEGESPASIKARVESFMQELLTSPMPVPNATAPGILTLARARCEFHCLSVMPSHVTNLYCRLPG